MKNGKGKIYFNNEEDEVFEGYFEDDKRHGLGVLQGKNQYLSANYQHGVKEGEYKKQMGPEYEEEGRYRNDELDGKVRIKKGQFVAFYRYENGVKMEEIQ